MRLITTPQKCDRDIARPHDLAFLTRPGIGCIANRTVSISRVTVGRKIISYLFQEEWGMMKWK
jgi:hypothetical protein